jgi:hypothetical protein
MENMFIRILKFGIIGTIIQLILYWIVFRAIQIISSLITNGEIDFFSDAGFFYSVGIFGIVLFVQNILAAISNRKSVYHYSAYIASFLIILGWCEDLNSWPIETICYMIISVTIIFGKFSIDKILAKYLVERKPNA